MLGRIRTPLGAIVFGVVVFGTVFATAASLTVNTAALPLAGSDTAVACDTDGVDVGYTIAGDQVNEIVVSDDDCSTGTITLRSSNLALRFDAPTKPNAATVAFRLMPPVSIESFDPGTISVTIVP